MEHIEHTAWEYKVARFFKRGFTPWCQECCLEAVKRGGNPAVTSRWVDAHQIYSCSDHVTGPARTIYVREYLIFALLPFVELFSDDLFIRLAKKLQPFR